jgi:RNA polymerase sigma factor (sigma-70 family)
MFNFDQTLIEQLKKQDHSAFNTFYLQTVDHFFRYLQANYYIWEQDCHDIIADFYVKRWGAATKYDERSKFSYYVWMVFKNIVKDYFKKNSDMPFTQLQPDPEQESFEDWLIDEEDINDLLETNFTYEHILEAMQALNQSDKEIIFLKFIEEKNTNEIAEICGVPNTTIRKRISRAIQNLKWLLNNTEEK